eukprot:Rhum_TRINITY_DN13614_c1_g1::Rhum_TRINITY_DN13614_c1_g1_i1::g.61979::m.61979/K16317/trmY; tRNA (pseudouridine54-N1)-methyltransferase
MFQRAAGCKRGFVLLLRSSRFSGNIDMKNLTAGRWDLVARVCTNALFVSGAVRPDTVLSCGVVPDGAPPARRGGAGRVVRVDGARVRHLSPDERTTAAAFRALLDAPPPSPGAVRDFAARHTLTQAQAATAMMHTYLQCAEGMTAAEGGMLDAVDDCVAAVGGAPRVVVLDGGGRGLRSLLASPPRHGDGEDGGDGSEGAAEGAERGVVFVLGDHCGLTVEDRAAVRRHAESMGLPCEEASLGRVQLLTSQCVSIVHHILDDAEEAGGVGGRDT